MLRGLASACQSVCGALLSRSFLATAPYVAVPPRTPLRSTQPGPPWRWVRRGFFLAPCSCQGRLCRPAGSPRRDRRHVNRFNKPCHSSVQASPWPAAGTPGAEHPGTVTLQRTESGRVHRLVDRLDRDAYLRAVLELDLQGLGDLLGAPTPIEALLDDGTQFGARRQLAALWSSTACHGSAMGPEWQVATGRRITVAVDLSTHGRRATAELAGDRPDRALSLEAVADEDPFGLAQVALGHLAALVDDRRLGPRLTAAVGDRSSPPPPRSRSSVDADSSAGRCVGRPLRHELDI
jgi:hypothetical protein